MRSYNTMLSTRYWTGVVTGLLFTSLTFASDRQENITVNLGAVSLPVTQTSHRDVYFARTDKELPAVCISCDPRYSTVAWKPLIPYIESSSDRGYLFDPGISGVLLRIQPRDVRSELLTAGDGSGMVAFELIRAGYLPVNAGTFQLPGPVLERIVIEKDSTGHVLNTTTTTFKVEGAVTIPTCQFEQGQAEINMPSGVSPQQLRTAGVGNPVKTVGAGHTDLQLVCATQNTGDVNLYFTASKTAVNGHLLSGSNGVGFVVSATANESPVVWNGPPVSVASMSGSVARIPLSAYYSWDGGDITPARITTQGLITLKYP